MKCRVTKKHKKTLVAYLGPCVNCGGKLTTESFIEETKKVIIFHMFAKCTKCDWTEDPRMHAYRPLKGVKENVSDNSL